MANQKIHADELIVGSENGNHLCLSPCIEVADEKQGRMVPWLSAKAEKKEG